MGLTESRSRNQFSSPRVRFTPLRNERNENSEITMEEVAEIDLSGKTGADDEDVSSEGGDDMKEQLTSRNNKITRFTEVESEIPLLPRWRLAVLSIGWFGALFMYLFLSLQIVPAQLRAFVGDDAKAKDLGFMVAGGGLITLIVSPAVGMASDRVRSRFGRRRPFMVIGTILVMVFLVACAIVGPHDQSVLESNVNKESNDTCYDADSLKDRRCNSSNNDYITKDYHSGRLGLYVTFYLLGMGSYAVATMPYSGLLADMTHPSLRGFASGVMGSLQILGSLTAAVVGSFVQDIGLFWAFIIIIVVFGGSMGITVFSVRERRIMTRPPRLKLTTILAAYVQPLKNWDFFWVFFTRFLMQMGVGTALG